MSANIGADPNLNLTLLQTQAQQLEALGPLIGLGNDGRQTVIVLDDDKDPPDKPVILKPTVDGAPIKLANHDFICKGMCFITGIKQELAAYRPQ